MKQKIISFGGKKPTRAKGRVGNLSLNNARRRRRRTGRQTLNYLLLLLVAASIITALSLTVFFKIETVTVQGNTKYAPEELIEASGISVGDNLFRSNERKAEAKIIEKHPYVENVKLKRNLPGKLVIQITEAKPLGAVNTASGYLIVSRAGRVLEMGAQTLPEKMTVVTGMYLYEPEIGRVLGTGYSKEETEEAQLEEEGFKMLNYLVDAIAQTGFDNLTLVDFSDRLNITVVYENRVIIELGSESNLVYKLNFVDKILADELKPDFEGVLDASIAQTSKSVYSRECDVKTELEKRSLAESVPIETQETEEKSSSSSDTSSKDESSPSGEEQSEPEEPENPDLAVIPGTASSSKTDENSMPMRSVPKDNKPESINSQDEDSESTQLQENGIYSNEDLAVVPGTAVAVESSSQSTEESSTS